MKYHTQQTEKNNKNNHILVTTPIFYPSGTWHVGTLYTIVLSDFLCSLLNQIGENALLMTGTDEHGNKVYKTALKNKIPVDLHLKNMRSSLQNLCSVYHINNKILWSHTSDVLHKKYVLDKWQDLQKKDLIYLDSYEGYYSEREESFYKKSDLITKDNELYTHMNEKVTRIKQKAWFLKLKEYKNNILKYIGELSIYPNNRRNEMISFINSNSFCDLCISREKGWGITTPDNHIIYVWFDALLNYFSVQKKYNIKIKSMIHVLAKDIIKFHGTYWPYLNKITDNQNISLLVHNWWTIDGHKLSKSFGGTINPMKLLNKYKPIEVKFYMLYNDLISSDKMFHMENIRPVFISFMIGKFSNLIYRIWSIIYKNSWQEDISKDLIIIQEDQDLKKIVQNSEINRILPLMFSWCNRLNAQINEEKPWINKDAALRIAHEIPDLLRWFKCIDGGIMEVNFNFPPQKIYDIGEFL